MIQIKIVVDIPTEQYNNIVYEDIDKLRECIKNGTVVNDDEWMKKADNIAKFHKRDALDEVRAEIESHIGGCGYLNDGLDLAIQIIDKHLRGEK